MNLLVCPILYTSYLLSLTVFFFRTLLFSLYLLLILMIFNPWLFLSLFTSSDDSAPYFWQSLLNTMLSQEGDTHRKQIGLGKLDQTLPTSSDSIPGFGLINWYPFLREGLLILIFSKLTFLIGHIVNKDHRLASGIANKREEKGRKKMKKQLRIEKTWKWQRNKRKSGHARILRKKMMIYWDGNR